MSRRTALAPLLLALPLAACSSLIPVGAVLESMDGDDVDVVIRKTADRYPNLSRFVANEGFVISLDSVVVGAPLQGPDRQTDRALVQAIVSYMLGETVGKQWISRVGGEDSVFGEGVASFLVARAPGGERFVLDASGFFNLVLPLGGGEGQHEGVELVTFDLRSSNQPIDPTGAEPPTIYAEVLPRNAIYSSKGPIFRNWANATFALSWRARLARSRQAGDGSPELLTTLTHDDRRALTSEFLTSNRPLVGPLIRLEVRFREAEDGTHVLSYGEPNRVELVLPEALVAGDRTLEAVTARLAERHPDTVRREGTNLLITVGQFFFYSDTTGPATTPPAQRAANAAAKRFRLPPEAP